MLLVRFYGVMKGANAIGAVGVVFLQTGKYRGFSVQFHLTDAPFWHLPPPLSDCGESQLRLVWQMRIHQPIT